MMSSDAGLEAFAEATSAALGGGVATALLYPLDTLRSKLAAVGKKRKGNKDNGLVELEHSVLDQIRAQGFMVLYSGLPMKLFKSCLGKFMYFLTYSRLKTAYAQNVGVVNPFPNLAIGYVSEWVHVPVTQPADIIVTRLQTGKASGVMDAITTLYGQGGVGAFFRGLNAQPILCLQPAIQFTIFDIVKRNYFKNRSLDMRTAFLLGAVARGVALCFVYPYLRAKTLVQTTNAKTSSKEGKKVVDTRIWPVLARIFRMEGVAGLWKGLPPELLRGVLSSALMMMIKERIRVVTRKFFLRKP